MCRRKVAREADIRARNRLAHSELSPHVQDACPSEFGIAMLLDLKQAQKAVDGLERSRAQ